MAVSQKQLEVQIMGQSYLLGCPDGGEARLLAAAQKVDAAMCRIRDAGKIKARDRIAVLAALNVAFEQNTSHALLEQPVDSRASASRPPTAQDGPQDVRLIALLRRLDRVLGQDGRLL
jgi:cell division protein ZapA